MRRRRRYPLGPWPTNVGMSGWERRPPGQEPEDPVKSPARPTVLKESWLPMADGTTTTVYLLSDGSITWKRPE